VNWRAFEKSPKLKLKPDVDLAALPDFHEYGMEFRAVKNVKSLALQEILEEGL
jgi:hypothetical protein